MKITARQIPSQNDEYVVTLLNVDGRPIKSEIVISLKGTIDIVREWSEENGGCPHTIKTLDGRTLTGESE